MKATSANITEILAFLQISRDGLERLKQELADGTIDQKEADATLAEIRELIRKHAAQ